ncbi:hypothetical protein PFJ87_04g01970 [Encephalitozoon hellem]|uniref:Uncharacterized protein n=1 Tax=Encephalitozoon hellem TaxID=27973 RepID=A0ABY8CJI8_ENCHE|nr:hypothetical protein PFJ87_03g00150 [Encephalitozoon hellem]WEL38321.1 hypothetical protein PFJ87_03g01810 [Encephalitozoon hellem]WEL38521.1 hypothetical protein PFJ87_04g01970 [Encephalitozoon hellem]
MIESRGRMMPRREPRAVWSVDMETGCFVFLDMIR